jgi:hypothetical protein
MNQPEVITTDKGFLEIPINLTHNLHIGGQCICDSCNDASFDVMHYIPVLAGRTYCQACFNKWHAAAEYYPEDAGYERAKAREFINQFN